MDTPPDDGPCEVTITAPDPEWLQAFARQLVEARLAAAAHVDMMDTTYRWAGQINATIEARATLHTLRRAIVRIDRMLSDQHPYEVPCLVTKTLDGGSSRYLEWISDSVS